LETIWWGWIPSASKIRLKPFVQKGREIAFLAGMWNDVEE
jgi:hypothetical protein